MNSQILQNVAPTLCTETHKSTQQFLSMKIFQSTGVASNIILEMSRCKEVDVFVCLVF